MEETKNTQGVPVEAIKTVEVGIKYNPDIVGRMIDNRFEGITPTILKQLSEHRVCFSEIDLRKAGCRFGTIKVNKDLSKGSMKATHRTTGEINPFITTGRGKNKTMPTRKAYEQYDVQVLFNIFWEKSVHNAQERDPNGVQTQWVPNEDRSNKIQNLGDSRVVCHKPQPDGSERFYLNYIVFRYLTSRKIVDENGQELDQTWVKGFSDKTDEQIRESRQHEADKHGVAVEFDPQIRQMRIDNMVEIRVFDTVYLVNQ